MKTDPDIYEPGPEDGELVLRDADIELRNKLTGKLAVEVLAAALKDAAFEYDTDDVITIATAEDLKVVDKDEYTRGYDLMRELSALDDRVTKWYARFDKPLAFLTNVVRGCRIPQQKQIAAAKQTLSKRLGTWKAEQDRIDAERQRKEQEAADLAAKVAQQAKADALERVAAQEADPGLAQAFRHEAQTVRSVETKAAPVEKRSSVPTVSGGFTKTTWKCEFTDVKELLKAYVEGRCFLDEDAIKKGLQSSLDVQAANLGANLSKAFPGTKAVPSYGAVARKTK